MLLKLITILYQERISGHNLSAEFSTFVYDYHVKKYGLKKVAE
jgi:hypothetical protein